MYTYHHSIEKNPLHDKERGLFPVQVKYNRIIFLMENITIAEV